jgi:hypothetical protein
MGVASLLVMHWAWPPVGVPCFWADMAFSSNTLRSIGRLQCNLHAMHSVANHPYLHWPAFETSSNSPSFVPNASGSFADNAT